MVIADTEIIAAAPVRFLAAGMGDAMATYYEARACQNNPEASSLIAPLTYRPPRIAMAIAGACLEVLYSQGVQATKDCEQKKVSTAVDAVRPEKPAGPRQRLTGYVPPAVQRVAESHSPVVTQMLAASS